MSNEWGPWIGWNGASSEKPESADTVVEFMNEHGYRSTDRCGDLWFDNIIAYRVKKEPVVEVRREAVIIGHGVTQIMAYAQCTYTDGKLTKIHWEVDQ